MNPSNIPPSALLLAAGESRRMGRPKLSLPFGAGAILEASLSHLLHAGICNVVVVVGQDNPLEAALQAHPEWPGSVRSVRNLNPAAGMLSSVQVGALQLEEGQDFLVALGDQPTIPSDLIRHLVEIFLERRPMVLLPTFSGKRGHPVLFSHQLRQPLLDLKPSATLRDLVHAYPILEVPASTDDIHRDIDSPEDYRAELERLAGT